MKCKLFILARNITLNVQIIKNEIFLYLSQIGELRHDLVNESNTGLGGFVSQVAESLHGTKQHAEIKKKIVLKTAQIQTLCVIKTKVVHNFVFKFPAKHHTEVKVQLLMSTCIDFNGTVHC